MRSCTPTSTSCTPIWTPGCASPPSPPTRPTRADVARSAEWLAEALRRTGFPTVEIWPTPGAPAVYAEWPSADAGVPVALVYGHHDVQPVDPVELWEHPPFEPTVVEARRRARAARPRRHRRQGQRRLPPARAARAPGRHRPRHPGGDGEAADRGRGGVRLAALRRPAARARRPAGLRRRRRQRHRHGRPRRAQRRRRHARPGRRRDHPARARRRPALGLLRRRRAQPAARDGARCWPRCTTTRAGSRCPASTTPSAR